MSQQNNRSSNIIKTLGTIILSCLLITSVIYAWTEPGSTPPAGSVSAPLNTGTTNQSKPANLTFPAFYDFNDTSYFIDPFAPTSALFAGNVGIGTMGPQTKLDVAGAIKIGTQTTCDSNTEGTIRYNSDRKEFEGCNGVRWQTIGSSLICGNSVSFIYKGSSVTYGTVESSGKCWMDRNLGASRVATAYNDSEAYGDLFQWGRLDDGHQTRDSNTITTLSDTDIPGHSNFIYGSGHRDWRSSPNDNLWQGALGINDPCPGDWRVPTRDEWETERKSWISNNLSGAFASPLKLTVTGIRDIFDAQIEFWGGGDGNYWSSTVDNWEIYHDSWYLLTLPAYSDTRGGFRGFGASVRCLK